MEDMDKKGIKEIIEWCDEKGHSEHEILDLIRRIVDAKPRNEEKPNEQALGRQKRRQTCQNVNEFVYSAVKAKMESI